jgi:hypothetical protein
MSREVVIHMHDDLDPTQDATETIEDFCLGGWRYVLDLTAQHAEDFRAALAPWLAAAHVRVPVTLADRKTPRTAQRGADGRRADNTRIRKWARANGFDVGDTGSIRAEVREAYERYLPTAAAPHATAGAAAPGRGAGGT